MHLYELRCAMDEAWKEFAVELSALGFGILSRRFLAARRS
jgi:hypothetical protein